MKPNLGVTKATSLLLLSGVAMLGAASAMAQIKAPETSGGVRFGDVEVTRYRVGATIDARRGAVRNITAMVAVPFPCPEQEVEVVDEDVTSNVGRYDYRTLADGGARQFVITIPFLPAGQKAHAIVTFEVRTRTILPPLETSTLSIPAKPDRQLKRFLGRSPFIETNHTKIKKAARQIFANLPAATVDGQVDPVDSNESIESPPLTDWQRVEAIYDFVQESIRYVEGDDKSAVQTLKDGQGDCQNISALFVALCRTSKIPARIVWVHEHNYAEFCLADAEGNLHWFPCESAGSRAFGEMPLARPILQKGDNFRVPERPRDRLRYASNFMVGEGLPGSGKPRVKYIQEQL